MFERIGFGIRCRFVLRQCCDMAMMEMDDDPEILWVKRDSEMRIWLRSRKLLPSFSRLKGFLQSQHCLSSDLDYVFLRRIIEALHDEVTF